METSVISYLPWLCYIRYGDVRSENTGIMMGHPKQEPILPQISKLHQNIRTGRLSNGSPSKPMSYVPMPVGGVPESYSCHGGRSWREPLPQGLDRSTRQQPPKQRSQVGVIISSALYVRANLYIRLEGIRTITGNNSPTIQWSPRLLTGVQAALEFCWPFGPQRSPAIEGFWKPSECR